MRFYLPRNQVHIGLWILLGCHSLLARLSVSPIHDWIYELARSNLFGLAAFLTVFHLLTDTSDRRQATSADYFLFAITGLALWIGGFGGSGHDVPLVLLPVALFYFSRFGHGADDRFIGLVALALSINGFFAPMLFHLFKDLFLIGEAQFAAALNRLIGLDVIAEGTRLTAVDGVRLQLIGACSVFSNLSFAFLGYSCFKAFFRSPMNWRDLGPILILMLALIFANAIRLGLMVPNWAAYEFWHHGSGSLIFAVVQFLLIGLVCLYAVILRGRIWRAA
ncbi:archaeosortase/exosortase family protein [Pseudooceanicola sp.]|uniref:archaeosortase/exosortase family protein n=1 Tax=Pseudooceanicola sp. TaxID=1914328 RepID=UPI0026131CB2|nr:archaeosortase/exosortase family protein [Pseudooceanicola sp.]MDF1855064.1 archaeosortase/exosortase family protein [Pseudooceanicola sp.]